MTRRQRAGIDHNALLTLRALLRERSVVRAARSLYLSQQAVSGALARLRDHFGDPLLERDGAGYRLTPLGEELLTESDAAVAALDEALRPVSQVAPDDHDRVFSVVASDHAMGVLGGPLVAAVAAAAPQTSVTLEAYRRADLADPAELLVHDVVIAPDEHLLPGRRRLILTDELVCVVDPRHPAIRDGAISAADLARMPFVAAASDDAPVIERALADAGLSPRRTSVVASVLTVPLLVPGSESFAIVPSRLVTTWQDAGELAVVTTPLELPAATLSLYWHPTRDDDPSLQWLVELLTGVAGAVAAEAPADLPA